MNSVEKSDKTKKIIALVLPLGVLALMGSMIYEFEQTKDSLYRGIQLRDSLIEAIQTNDSLFCSSSTKFSGVVNKYITGDCKVRREDGKELSLNELVNLYNKAIKDHIRIEKENADELRKFGKRVDSAINAYETCIHERSDLLDTISRLTSQLKLIKEEYGFSFHSKLINKNEREIWVTSPKVDSALRLLPHYRNRLSYNADKKYWEITVK